MRIPVCTNASYVKVIYITPFRERGLTACHLWLLILAGNTVCYCCGRFLTDIVVMQLIPAVIMISYFGIKVNKR